VKGKTTRGLGIIAILPHLKWQECRRVVVESKKRKIEK
jgi:hypothetical protein